MDESVRWDAAQPDAGQPETVRLMVGGDAVVAHPYGDACLLLKPEEPDDERAWQLTQLIRTVVLDAEVAGLTGLVSSYRHLLVEFDPGVSDAPVMTRRLAAVLADATGSATPARTRELVVPVVFGGRWGPDLDDVAALAGRSATDLVHSLVEDRFTVRFLGPGMEPMSVGRVRRAVPRRDSPRTQVPPGSVSMAGDNLSIYPFASPGGWQILGRTPLAVCDISRDPPVAFRPGDVLRLLPVAEHEVTDWGSGFLGEGAA